MKSSTQAAVVISDPDEPRRSDIASRRFSLVAETSADRATPIWQPPPRLASSIPTSSDLLATGRLKHELSPELERCLIDALNRPLECNETHAVGNANRERDVRALFDTLTPIDALALRRRLDGDRSDDPIVLAFRRLLAERRTRLKAYLADPRRGQVRR